jgi:hypothetical protein
LTRRSTYLIEGLSEKQEEEIIIRDNINNWEWDMELLADWDRDDLEDWGLVESFSSKPAPWEIPEVDFTTELLEKNNYVVLFFDNDVDWLNLMSIIDLPTVKNLWGNWQGVGRVLNGADFINILKK